MNPVIYYFQHLFSTDGFPPRWLCGFWTSFHGWLYIASDLAIWAAYYTIPFVLVRFTYRRKDIPFPKIFWLFAAFIFLCGTTHFMDALMFWWPAYRFTGLIYFYTALVSWATIWALARIMPSALELKSPAQLEKIVAARTAELRESDRRFSATFHQAAVGMAHLDKEGHYLRVNKRFEEITGYPEEDLLNLTYEMTFAASQDQYEQLLMGNIKEIQFERPFSRKNGSVIWAKTTTSAVSDAQTGELQFVFVVLEDVTARKQAEAELKASEKRWYNLSNSIPQLVWMAHADGWIYWYNDRWYEYTGTTPSDMEGWGWQSVHDPEVLPVVINKWQAALQNGQPFEMIFPLRGANGEFRQFLTKTYPERDEKGDIIQWFGTNTDITEQLKIAAALRESERRYSATFEQAAVGIGNLTEDGYFLKINERYCEMLGYSEEEMLSLRFQDITHPDDLESDIHHYLQLKAGEIDHYFMEKRYIRKDGSVIWVNLTCSLVRKEDNTIDYAIAVVEDISQRKRAEAERQRYEAKLERSYQELEEFAFIAAHDLQEPLRKARLFSSMLVRNNDKEDEQEKVKKYGSRLENSLAGMQSQLDSLSMLTKISRKQHFLPVDLNGVVDAAQESLQSLIHEKNARLEVEAFNVKLLGDEQQLTEVFRALLSNAFKFTWPGVQPIVKIQVQSQTTTQVVITVEDNGIGMSGAYKERIFAPFETLNDKAMFDGVGIGLTICRRIIEHHNGSIVVESKPSEGTKFLITLPVYP